MRIPILSWCLLLVMWTLVEVEAEMPDGRYLYVATPGIRNYLEFGGHGLLVYAIDDNYRFIKRIPTAGLKRDGSPENVKGVCASADTGLLHIANLSTLTCVDLRSENVLWEKAYEGGCDRMGIAPDGSYLYLPSLEKAHWHVVSATDGSVMAKITPDSRSHNTIVGRNGKEAYLAGLGSPFLTIADTNKHQADRKVGPFSHNIRPFTVNGDQTRIYANVNDLLGFEIGDLENGKMLARIEVKDFEKGPVKRHGCPSHGIAMTPDGREIWLSDGHNSRIHVFAMDGDQATQVASVPVRDQPGWITMRFDGVHAWSSSGEVFDINSRKIVATLTDEEGREVGSEKMVEVHWKGGKPVLCGDQFGYGRNSLKQAGALEKPAVISLWKNGAPGSEARMNEPEILEGKNVTNIHNPSITPYLPSAEDSTGTAIIIAPGGGHRMLCLGHEGDSLAAWFAERGIAAFVLRYRLSREEGSNYTLKGHAMDDTRRAIRTVRLRANEWNINADRVGILGFSAGGELAAYAAMESDNGNLKANDPVDRMGCRPDFQGLIYPGKSDTFTVHQGMPPAFIALGYNDRPDISIGMAKVYLKYKEAEVPCEMHVYSNAGHGFGYNAGTTSAAGAWPERLCEWLVDSKLLSRH